MRKAQSKKKDNSLTIATVFVSCILLLIVGGFLLKILLVVSQSHFDSFHQYIVEVDESNSKGMLISFAPNSKSVTFLTVLGKVDNSYGKYLDVPVDGYVHMVIPQNLNQLTEHLLFGGKEEKGITIIDKLRLLFFVNTLKPGDFHQQTVQLPVDAQVTEKLLPTIFLDSTLYADNESVAVINATGESGIGTKVAHQLTTIGVNVISVTTSDDESKETTLSAIHPHTYTVSRIERIFHVSSQTTTNHTISDITLVVGKNSLSQLQ